MFSKNSAYLFRRLLPFLLLFLGVETAMRFVFLLLEWSNIKGSWLVAPLEFLSGLFFDLCVFAYFLIPLALYVLFLSPKRFNASVDRVTSSILFTVLSYILLFTSVSEWFFWDEFASRFNFIAVDYLVYTHEVIGNIMESYPVIPLMLTIGAIAVVFGVVYYRLWNKIKAVKPSKPGSRFKPLFIAIPLAVLSFIIGNGNLAEIGSNHYLHEIGKNGIFELFSAYRNNELSYDKFYTSIDSKDVRRELRQKLQADGQFKGKEGITRHVKALNPENHYNLVLITVESLSANYMSTFGNKENITPHLDALAKNSLFFSNLYATGTRTVYGLSAITLSIPPLPGNSIVRRPHNENLFSLGSVLNSHGYVSKFLYGGDGFFDNMNYFFGENGYEIVDRPRLKKEEITFSNVWGVADEDIFNHTLKENDAAHKAGKPFFDMIMTTSNHRPFTYPDGRIDIPSKTGRNGAVKYTDYAINKFLNDARKHPWFDKTIFVVIADHTAGSARKSELDPDGYHIPLFIYAPKLIKPRVIDSMVSQIDLAPTLLSLLGISYDSRFYGVDVLAQKQERAFISNYQQLGYMTPKQLAILKPVRQVATFQRRKDGIKHDKVPDDHLLKDAISYFQGATNWKEWNKAAE